LERLKALGYPVETSIDSNHFIIENLVLAPQDTLKSIRFRLNDKGGQSKFTLTGVDAGHPLTVENLKALKKRYEDLVEAGLVAKVEE
jgi:hypothetical protein